MQAGEHQFHRGDLGHLVHLHRNTSAIVLDGDRAVGMNGDPDVFAVAREMLVNGVVHHFKHAVVQAAFIRVSDVHARAEADGFKPFQFLNLIGAVSLI